jgi:hypothetical protein
VQQAGVVDISLALYDHDIIHTDLTFESADRWHSPNQTG